MEALTAALRIQHMAIDGKTLRGSGSAKLGPLHLVSAWATAQHLSLGPVAVDAKSNEITAIPALLELLDLSGVFGRRIALTFAASCVPCRPSQVGGFGMRSVLVFSLLLLLAGATQAKGLRFRVVDASSGAPIAGATIERWASQWQPRILLPPGKFWFPAGKLTTDAEGFAFLEVVARDDWYAIKAGGYEEGSVARSWFKFQFTARAGGSPRDMVEQSGALVVPLRPGTSKEKDRQAE
ncbi:MAG: ISAs1 family transposase [Gemmataceae bacterium]|nr:ISAs1 family transposase [Gemmataceae bacterium]